MTMNDMPHMSSPTAGLLHGRRIMVVEDSLEERMLLSMYLQQEGCRVYLAQNGLDGLNKIRLIDLDLILLDVGMPECDGLTACHLLKADPRTRDIPVMFLTGAANPNDRVNGLLAGAVDYITKPFMLDEIRLRLLIHLRDRPAVLSEAPDQPDRTGRDSQEPVPSLDSRLFQSARLKLIQRLEQGPDLHELASALDTTPKRLNEAFRKAAGVSVAEYLREERMKQGRELLNGSTLKIQEIATLLGFSSGANFATAFKERFGLSPRDFRSGQEADKG